MSWLRCAARLNVVSPWRRTPNRVIGAAGNQYTRKHSTTQAHRQTVGQTDSVLCEIPRHAAKAQMYLFVYTHYTYLNVCTYILFLCAYVIDGTASEFFLQHLFVF